MKGVANFLLGVVIVSFLMMSFSNVLMFFPWYLTIVYKTFSIATEASTVNYVQASMVDDAKKDLASRPVFKEAVNTTDESNTGYVETIADNPEDNIQIKMDGKLINTINEESFRKQRGEKFTVTTEAIFPFKVKFFGKTFVRFMKVEFSIPTTGIRYYKDKDEYVR